METNDSRNDEDCQATSESEEETSPTKRTHHVITGRGVTLSMLIDEKMIEPGDGILTMEYMNKHFVADLLPNGKIKWPETGQEFNTPSAWAIHCKQQVNPEKKSGCGWASVKYKGKKLDAWKYVWFKKHRESTGLYSNTVDSPAPSIADSYDSADILGHEDHMRDVNIGPHAHEKLNQHTKSCTDNEDSNEALDLSMSKTTQSSASSVAKCQVVKHSDLISSQNVHTLVECVPFASQGTTQPFTLSISSNCLLMMDFHCHLTKSEVVGYLGGKWDSSLQHLTIQQSFPCRCRLADKENAVITEMEVQYNMQQRGLSLVGWYHSHPNQAAEPSLRDIECQMEYQLKGAGSGCSPCIGLIVAPYELHSRKESEIRAYWIVPPPESHPDTYGMPMALTYNTTQDLYLSQDVLNEMSWLVDFYTNAPDLINFKHIWQQSYTFFDKLKSSLTKKLPKEHTESQLLEYIKELLKV